MSGEFVELDLLPASFVSAEEREVRTAVKMVEENPTLRVKVTFEIEVFRDNLHGEVVITQGFDMDAKTLKKTKELGRIRNSRFVPMGERERSDQPPPNEPPSENWTLDMLAHPEAERAA